MQKAPDIQKLGRFIKISSHGRSRSHPIRGLIGLWAPKPWAQAGDTERVGPGTQADTREGEGSPDGAGQVRRCLLGSEERSF